MATSRENYPMCSQSHHVPDVYKKYRQTLLQRRQKIKQIADTASNKFRVSMSTLNVDIKLMEEELLSLVSELTESESIEYESARDSGNVSGTCQFSQLFCR